MKINNTSKQNFGWNLKTHYKLTSTIADRIPNLRKYSKLLATASFLPDIQLSQTSVGYRMAHYFDGKNFNAYDIVPQNASDFYLDNLSKALGYLHDRLDIPAMIKAGYALHFLQDVAVPLHTNPACFSQLKLLRHIQYESIPSKNPILFENVLEKISPQNDKYFYDCFLDTYRKSSTMQNPFSLSKKQWQDSVQESLQNAYEHTCLFLKKLSEIKDAPADKQREAFVGEFFAHLKNIKSGKI